MPGLNIREKKYIKAEERPFRAQVPEIIGRKSEAVALAYFVLDTKRCTQATQEHYTRQGRKTGNTSGTPHAPVGHEEERVDEGHRKWEHLITTRETRRTDALHDQDHGPISHVYHVVMHAPGPSLPV